MVKVALIMDISVENMFNTVMLSTLCSCLMFSLQFAAATKMAKAMKLLSVTFKFISLSFTLEEFYVHLHSHDG